MNTSKLNFVQSRKLIRNLLAAAGLLALLTLAACAGSSTAEPTVAPVTAAAPTISVAGGDALTTPKLKVCSTCGKKKDWPRMYT